MPISPRNFLPVKTLLPDFDTHTKYIRFILEKANGLTFTACPALIGDRTVAAYKSKRKLIELTARSIQDEFSMLEFDNDYGTPASLWIPVKTYYLLYHQLSALRYLISGNEDFLRMKHCEALVWYAEAIKNGHLRFSCPEFNFVGGHQVLEGTVLERPGELFTRGFTDEKVLKLIIRKAAKDKIQEEKRRVKWSLRKPAHRLKQDVFKHNLRVTLLDFFYCMRIRTNYRDVDFTLDASSERVAAYARTWAQAGLKISGAFDLLIALMDK